METISGQNGEQEFSNLLIDGLAQLICNWSHSNIDVWAMLEGNEPVRDLWRLAARNSLKDVELRVKYERHASSMRLPNEIHS